MDQAKSIDQEEISQSKESKEIKFQKWFHSKGVIGGAMFFLFSIGNPGSISLFTSKIASPSSPLTIPLSKHLVKKIPYLGIVNSIIRDIPTLCLQLFLLNKHRVFF